jgi:hypothetical protein
MKIFGSHAGLFPFSYGDFFSVLIIVRPDVGGKKFRL